jgi:hypothetical protein
MKLKNVMTFLMVVCACSGSMFWLILIQKMMMRFLTNHYLMTEIFRDNMNTLIFVVVVIIQGVLSGHFYSYYKSRYENMEY